MLCYVISCSSPCSQATQTRHRTLLRVFNRQCLLAAGGVANLPTNIIMLVGGLGVPDLRSRGSGRKIPHETSHAWNSTGPCHSKSIGEFQQQSTGANIDNPLDNTTEQLSYVGQHASEIPWEHAADNPRWSLRCWCYLYIYIYMYFVLERDI